MSYEDIIFLPHPRSLHHSPMSMEQRAAQFSSFAALRGFDDEIAETARFTEERPELDDAKKSEIADTLTALKERGEGMIFVEYFIPDRKKKGGSLRTKQGALGKIEDERSALSFEDGDPIPFSAILDIQIL